MAGKRKTGIGTVVSNKMDKTVVVSVESYRTHRLYKRRMKRTSRFKAHDEKNACKPGDTVRIEETRPLSRDKRWRVTEILATVDIAESQPKEIGEESLKS